MFFWCCSEHTIFIVVSGARIEDEEKRCLTFGTTSLLNVLLRFASASRTAFGDFAEQGPETLHVHEPLHNALHMFLSFFGGGVFFIMIFSFSKCFCCLCSLFCLLFLLCISLLFFLLMFFHFLPPPPFPCLTPPNPFPCLVFHGFVVFAVRPRQTKTR